MNEEEEKKIIEEINQKRAEPETPEEDYKEKYLETLAEMENMRKRMQRERYEMSKFGIEGAIGGFIPLMDNFEHALNFAGEAGAEVKNWAMGFEMILTQFKDVLTQNGIEAYSSKGEQFDPLLHEAIETVETDEYPDGTIIEEMTKGYKSSSRTIRPARVKVAKQPKPEQSQDELKEGNEKI